ncbi:MAG: phosphotransferase enzyme family protein [Mangrovicoccus sp.]
MTPDFAAQAWGQPARAPRLIAERENAVYELWLQDGRHLALRRHRQNYQSAEAVAAELSWTYGLSQQGFPCPAPCPTQDGTYFTETPDGALWSAVAWLAASPLEDANPEKFRQLGALIARLHATSDGLDLPLLPRPEWDITSFCCSDTPIWGRFWENPSLSPSEADRLSQARQDLQDRLSDLQQLDKGLIHGDLLPDNILQGADGLHIIDFDDGGYGYRLYDLATALIQHLDHPDYPALQEALCQGYGQERGWDPAQFAPLPLFLLCRALASAGWVIGRLPATDPKCRAYAKRALNLSARVLGV